MSCCGSHKTCSSDTGEAAVVAGGREVVLSLEGLHCINCVGKVEALLREQNGVSQAKVNLTQKRARLQASDSFSVESAVAALADAGFSARELTRGQVEQRSQEDKEQKTLLLRMAVAGSVAANVMLLSVALYAGQFQGMETGLKRFFQVVSFCLCTPAVIYCGAHFLEPAWKNLKRGRVTIDVPISVGLLATYTLSVVSFFVRSDNQYFDTVSAFLFALLVGRYLQSLGMSRVRSSLDFLLGLRPQKATVLHQGEKKEIPIQDLQVGHQVVLEQDSLVPADGILLSGIVEVDEQAMTGESLPVEKVEESSLLAGTKVFSGEGVMLVEATGSKTSLSRLGKLIEESQESRIPEGTLSDRIAGIFSALILVLAFAVFLYWLPQGTEQATLIAVSVLVITCPCALGLALPLAYWMAVRTGVENGVLIKDQSGLEKTYQLTDLVFDKTGTLTEGKARLCDEFFSEGQSEQAIGPIVEAMERGSAHPFARALIRRFSDFDGEHADLVEDLPGRGRRLVVGNDEFVLGRGSSNSEARDVELRKNGTILAGWSFQDGLRPEASGLVEELRQRGLKLHLLSGDREERTHAIAQELQLNSFQGRCLPDEKSTFVGDLQDQGSVVGLLGDGINDGPALSKADVGAAMGHATSIAAGSAPVLLLRPGLSPVLAWLNLGEAYRRTVKKSLVLSALYNLVAVPLAASGFVTPLLAAIAMPLASVAVIVNSLRLGARLEA